MQSILASFPVPAIYAPSYYYDQSTVLAKVSSRRNSKFGNH